jgi:hypothetical protein
MPKRILLIIAAVLVLAFLVYVGVSATNGSYAEAAGNGAQDVAAAQEGNAVLAKIRTAPGVTSATFTFTPGLIAVRKSTIAAKMSGDASPADVRRVADLVLDEYSHAPGTMAGAMLTITQPGAAALTITSFSKSSAELASDLAIWESIPQSTDTSISVEFGDRSQRTLALVSTRRASIAWIRKHYAVVKALAADGFTWTNPAGCDLNDLPDQEVLAVMTKLSAIVPVACNSSKEESVLTVQTDVPHGAVHTHETPSALLGFVSGVKTEPFSVHVSEFAQVARVLLSPEAPNMNVGFFGIVNGKPTDVLFFTGTCATGIVTHPDKEDAASLSMLKAHGVDVAARATLGQCSPRPATPTATPTPAG